MTVYDIKAFGDLTKMPLQGKTYTQIAQAFVERCQYQDAWREVLPIVQEWLDLASDTTFHPEAAEALLRRAEERWVGTAWNEFRNLVRNWIDARAAMAALMPELEGQTSQEKAKRMLRFYDVCFSRSAGHPGLEVAREWVRLTEAETVERSEVEAVVARVSTSEWNGWNEPLWSELRDMVQQWAQNR